MLGSVRRRLIIIDHNIIKNNGINGIYCTGGTVVIQDNTLSGNHCAVNPGGGQIDVGNAFTTNTVAVIKGNPILGSVTMRSVPGSQVIAFQIQGIL